jgi:hypothetical protein
MPPERDWQRAGLARSVSLPIRWPNNRLQRTAVRAVAEPERYAAARPPLR